MKIAIRAKDWYFVQIKCSIVAVLCSENVFNAMASIVNRLAHSLFHTNKNV